MDVPSVRAASRHSCKIWWELSAVSMPYHGMDLSCSEVNKRIEASDQPRSSHLARCSRLRPTVDRVGGCPRSALSILRHRSGRWSVCSRWHRNRCADRGRRYMDYRNLHIRRGVRICFGRAPGQSGNPREGWWPRRRLGKLQDKIWRLRPASASGRHVARGTTSRGES
ncbi:hypothetical protein ES703_19824 [subsurface metagenome]